MTRFGFLLIPFILMLGAGGVQAQTVVDNFESYDDGQIIGPSAQSTPWRRFGNATVDNVVATAHPSKVIAGDLSAQYVVRWPAKFGSARYAYAAPTDLRAYAALSLTLRSDQAQSGTVLRLVIDDGETSFLSKASFPVTDQAQRCAVALTAAAFERAAGNAAFDAVLAKIKSIGFNVTNPRTEAQGQLTQVLVFDGLCLYGPNDALPADALPEP
jgi:hypothetical protein